MDYTKSDFLQIKKTKKKTKQKQTNRAINNN